jgi:BASS family bile acid:Na+ symporter
MFYKSDAPCIKEEVSDKHKMKPLILRLIERTDLILFLSIALSLMFPVDMTRFKWVIEIGLGIVMFFSLKPFIGRKIHFKEGLWAYAKPLILNYIVLSGAYILFAYFLFGRGHDFFIGYLLMAVVPPAVSIIPFCYISRCNAETSNIPVLVASVLSLLIIPGTLSIFLAKSVDFAVLMKVMTVVIIIPMFLAYKTAKSDNRLFDYGKAIINMSLAAIIFVSIALNRDVFFNISDSDVISVYIISILIVFCMGFATYFLTRRRSPENATEYTFFATQKNLGTSITLGIFLFNPNTAVPAIITLVIQFLFFIFFEMFFVKSG